MKIKISKIGSAHGVLALILLSASAHAQTKADLTGFLTPIYRGQAGTESVIWNESYTNAYNSPNNASSVAAGGVSLANASVTQTTSGAFLLGSPAGDIYSFSSINTFVLNYSVSNPGSFPNGVGNIIFQTETLGAELDYSSVQLSYTSGLGLQTLSATANELYRSTGDFGGFGESSDVITEWEWNLPLADDITSFSIAFNGSGTSLGMERTLLDVASFNVAPVPEPNTLMLAGIGGLGLLFWTRRFRAQSSR